MKKSPIAGMQVSFEATLENWAEGMGYCAVPVPARITDALGTRGPVLIMARLKDSAPFKVSLFPVGGGKHYIRIKADVRRETQTKTGDTVHVRITVLDQAAVLYPTLLLSALRAQGATKVFKDLPPGARISSSGASMRQSNLKPARSEFETPFIEIKRLRPR